jgi:hypothetical protein
MTPFRGQNQACGSLACTMHALRPESEAQSIRFKVKLVAAKYISDMTVVFPSSLDPIRRREVVSRTRAAGSAAASASAVLLCARWESGKGTTAAICSFAATIGAFPSRPLRRHGNMRAMSSADWIANGEAGRKVETVGILEPMLPSLAGRSCWERRQRDQSR